MMSCLSSLKVSNGLAHTVMVMAICLTIMMSSFASAALAASSAISTVQARLLSHYATNTEPGGPATEKLLAGLSAAGTWPDLEATFDADEVGYARYWHFQRIRQLAIAWHDEENPPQKSALADAIHRALSVWLGREAPSHPNWQKQIGAPKLLAQTAILFADQLTAGERSRISAILKICVRPDGTLDYAGSPATGANLLDEAEIQIAAACLSADATTLKRYAAAVEQELAPGRTESIQADGSFHQHGPQLYSGGYGAVLAHDAAALAWALRDTEFAFSPATVDGLLRFVLDGTQRMTRGRSLDFVTVGRQISRVDLGGPTDILLGALDLLAPLAGGRADELENFAKRLRGAAPPATAPVGTSVFWNSDYVTHSRPEFFASARMSSRRVEGTESGNGENELGYHLGDGAMTLMVTGEEYRNLFPLWDWRHVPGVSCVVNPATPFPRHVWGRGAEGCSDFAGGVAEGGTGAAAMELRRGGLHARKAWFFLADAVVCLGSDILPDDPALPVVTSIDQRWARGAVTTSFDAAPLTPGLALERPGPGWVQHDGVSYLFPETASLRILVEHRSAPWSAINHSVNLRGLGVPSVNEARAEGDVFSLWIDHGTGINVPATYAYLVVPGLDPKNIPAFLQTTKILQNTPEIQAVATGTLVQAAFWKRGDLTLPDGLRIGANQPCLLQLRRPPGGAPWMLAVGNPTHLVGDLQITLASASAPVSDSQTITFTFPEGPFTGQPQTRSLPAF